MKLFIRPAQPTDLPAIYEICLRTGNNGQDASGLLRDDILLGQFFAAPYLHYELSSCFVIDKAGFAVGYIIGVKDTLQFNQWLNKHWLPNLIPAYPARPNDSDLERYIIDTIHNGIATPYYAEQFPSHLHIDLLPCAQGSGLGKELIATFISHLKHQGSKGVHLGVGTENKKAIGFYRRVGFNTLSEDEQVVILTQNFSR